MGQFTRLCFVMCFIGSFQVFAQDFDFRVQGFPEMGSPEGQGTALIGFLAYRWPEQGFSSTIEVEYRLRSFVDAVEDAEKSLLSQEKSLVQVFLHALEGRTKEGVSWGGGLYTSHEKLKQSGFFRLNLGDPWQIYVVNFSSLALGPLLTAGWGGLKWDFFQADFGLRFVPIFWVHSSQTKELDPGLAGKVGSLDWENWGWPYWSVQGDFRFVELVSLLLIYEGFSVTQKGLRVGGGDWQIQTEDVFSQGLQWTLSFDLNLGEKNRASLGAGQKWEWVSTNGQAPTAQSRGVLNLAFGLED